MDLDSCHVPLGGCAQAADTMRGETVGLRFRGRGVARAASDSQAPVVAQGRDLIRRLVCGHKRSAFQDFLLRGSIDAC